MTTIDALTLHRYVRLAAVFTAVHVRAPGNRTVCGAHIGREAIVVPKPNRYVRCKRCAPDLTQAQRYVAKMTIDATETARSPE